MKMQNILAIQIIIILKLRHTCYCHGMGEVTNGTNFITTVSEPSLPADGLGVAGGVFAHLVDYPHSVLFVNYGGVCAGSIISNKLVLTSAHCLDHNRKKSEMTVFAEFGYMHCRLKDMGEVTNFSRFLDNESYRLASVLKKIVKDKGPRLKPKSLGVIEVEDAYPTKFPHNVVFMNYEMVCSGIIISDAIVLTCAHCLDHSQNLLEMRVLAGARYLFDRAADVYKVWDFVIHNRYNNPIKFSNDAALLIIRDQFRFKPTVQRALLINHKLWMKEGTVVKVTGWGETKHGTEKVSENGLQSADLKMLSHRACKNSAGTMVTPDMFCLWGNGERATCRGDSGGGALWNGMIVGIVSHGGACGTLPGLYTNVYFLRSWIEEASKKLYFKFCNFHYPHFGDY